eukprot:scaffold4814_cov161-Amphora_coffeaeformis.AAC.3
MGGGDDRQEANMNDVKSRIIRASSKEAQDLLQAAADGRLEDLEKLIKNNKHRKILQTIVCSSGCNALCWASGNGHGHVVDYLLRPVVKENHHHHQEPLFHADCPAVGKSQGRTALHYACRNGHEHVVRKLVEEYGANPNAKARHSVTPLQLAVWQGRLSIARYLVETSGVNPKQTNDFECGLVHWLGLAPRNSPAVEMARWLHEELALPMHNVVQRQLHSPLHKAAWGGHLDLCRYLHETVGLWDDRRDAAGNYAVDLARMAQHETCLTDYLQRVASRTTFAACQLLQVSLKVHERSLATIQGAYRRAIRACHPDGKEKRRRQWIESCKDYLGFEQEEQRLVEHFQALTRAYRHLIACATNDDDNEKLLQDHATHELPRLLTQDGTTPTHAVNDDCFEARLLQVVQQNRSGLDISNLVKKWKQVWPGVDFPTRTQASLQQWLMQEASHVVTIRADDKGILRLYPRLLHSSQ